METQTRAKVKHFLHRASFARAHAHDVDRCARTRRRDECTAKSARSVDITYEMRALRHAQW
jgi:hypothetical protein